MADKKPRTATMTVEFVIELPDDFDESQVPDLCLDFPTGHDVALVTSLAQYGEPVGAEIISHGTIGVALDPTEEA